MPGRMRRVLKESLHSCRREWPLLALLCFGLLVRIWLSASGGQLFIPDEQFRFGRAYTFLTEVQRANWPAALPALLQSDHPLFAVAGLPIAALHVGYAAVAGVEVDRCLWFPSSLLSLTALANIVFVWALARRSGSGPGEAWLAAFLMSVSLTMFHYGRHLLPYDLSMALCLWSLWLGWNENATARRSFACGTLVGFAVMIWMGGWYLGATVLLLHWLRAPGASRALGAAAGVVFVSAGTFILVGMAQGAVLGSVHAFSKTAVYGDFSEGWSHPWEFLLLTERLLFVVWLATAAALPFVWRNSGAPFARSGMLWLTGAATLYGLLFLFSTVLHKFVCYGRLDRQMVPFFCLGSAWTLCRLPWRGRSARLVLGVLLLLLSADAGVRFWGALRLRFPRDIRLWATQQYGPLKLAWSVENVPPKGELNSRYVLYNPTNMWPMMKTVPPEPGTLLLRVEHPLAAFPAYQYEQFSPSERQFIDSGDISIQLIDLGPR